jgi:cobalt-zinc-cadmium efflux system outer membrane protein
MSRTAAVALTLFLFRSLAFSAAQAPTTQTSAQPVSLDDLEKLALGNNPLIEQAAAGVAAAQGRARQAGLYPNPSVGLNADEVAPGPIIRYGEWGFFIQQDIVLGGKLSKDRRTVEQDVVSANIQAEAQRLRVLTIVRQRFYQALAAERAVKVRTQLLTLARQAVSTSQQLKNVGQADEPDVLEIEIELQRAEIALAEGQSRQAQIWKQLAAAVGDADLSLAPLAGAVEDLPTIQLDQALSTLLRDSPEIKLAQTAIVRAETVLERARVEKIPNLDLRGGLRYNRELLETGQRPVGLEGFIDAGVRIPLFDRNQGNVAAAEAELRAAKREVDRVSLALLSRFAEVAKEYSVALTAAEKYRTTMLPRAERAYDLYMANVRQMAAAYPQALIAQRTLFQLQDEYNALLARVWSLAADIQGLLLIAERDLSPELPRGTKR